MKSKFLKIRIALVGIGLVGGLSAGLIQIVGAIVQQQYYKDHRRACEEANRNFFEAREQYARFRQEKLKIYSEPAISSLEEMATFKSYDCTSILLEESCESIESRFPLIKVNRYHGEWKKCYISKH